MSLDDIAAQVVALLVDTFDFPRGEAQHRVNLWLAEQHRLEGQVLLGLLPQMTPEEASQSLLHWVLEGDRLEQDLRQGAKDLDIPIAE